MGDPGLCPYRRGFISARKFQEGGVVAVAHFQATNHRLGGGGTCCRTHVTKEMEERLVFGAVSVHKHMNLFFTYRPKR